MADVQLMCGYLDVCAGVNDDMPDRSAVTGIALELDVAV